MSPELQAKVDALIAILPALRPDKQEFAASLLAAAARYGDEISDGRRHWLGELVRRHNAGSEAPETVRVGDFAGMTALFDKAAQTLKRPAIALRDETVGEIRINVAGPNARHPGTLNIVTPGGFGNGKWFGRIRRDGQLEKSNRDVPPDSLVELLVQFAKAPAETAAHHGRLHGRCCFCAGALSDPVSAAVGYGKTCAGKWGMPYSAEFARSLAPVVPVGRRRAA